MINAIAARHVPSFLTEYRREGEAVIYSGARQGGKVLAMGFRSGRQKNHDFYYSLRSEAELEQYAEKYFAGIRASADAAAARKAEKAADRARPNPFKERDLLVYSWGWEQTNIEFYQVVATTAKGVTVRQVAQETVDDDAQGLGMHSMAEYVTARRDVFLDRPAATKILQWSDGKAYIKMDHGYARPWDGRKMYQSHYA